MIKGLSLNTLKLYEWQMDWECGGLMSGLILIALQNDSLFEKGDNIFHKTSMDMLMEAFPMFKSSTNIMKYLKILESKGLIILDIEKFSINYMFTEKGTTWLVYDLAYSRKIEEASNGSADR